LGSVDTLEALMSYIDGFSPNAREILVKFKMEETCKTLAEHGMLYEVCRRFAAFDMSPETLSDREMTNIYEHLIERFGEAIAEDAEDFMTPKDVVRLAVGMLFANDDEMLNLDNGTVRTLYDPTIGTGGFVSDALDQLDEWHAEKQMVAPTIIVPYGQEIEAESWAMCKANLLLRNVSNADKDQYDAVKDMSAHIAYGDTLADDKFEGMTFNYLLSNPPYGKKWEKSQSAVLDEAKLGFKGRFGAGLPSIDDGSMLFIQHVVSKFAPLSEGGGKACIVLSGSPLFTGDAGSGPSNIRRWLFEKDYIDCIVKLPQGEFFRTGINTYLWVLSNHKPEGRKGFIQLIDASEMKTTLRKNQGQKRCEISKEQREWIIRTYIDGHDHGKSVMVPVEDFMYRKVTTQRPLRAALKLSEENINATINCKALAKLSENNKMALGEIMSEHSCLNTDETVSYDTAAVIAKLAREEMDKPETTVAVIAKAIKDNCTIRGAMYPIVIEKGGVPVPDKDLKDSENVPYTMDIDEYMAKEVLPYADDTWVDETVLDAGPMQDGKVGVVGTNISFNKYFYHYEEPRKPETIAKEIFELENGLEAFMEGFLK
ncbi:MAG: N-6 DNA methylase, partial [Bacillota bacterium]|nr:N-6 DNA methylase [Bacillota bacterium]